LQVPACLLRHIIRNLKFAIRIDICKVTRETRVKAGASVYRFLMTMTEERKKKSVYNCPNCGAAATPQSVRCAYCRSSLATLVCAKCYGAIFLGMKHCPWCGENAEGGKPVEEATTKCPHCSVPFLIVNVGKRIIHECPACGGLWVSNTTFQEICADQEQQQWVMGYDFESQAANSAELPRSGRTYIPCPECGKLMNRRQFAGCSGVIVDWCKPHGTWFDRDELKRIVQFILGGGLSKSREREKTKLEEERQKLREERRNLEILSRLAGDSTGTGEPENRDLDLIGLMGGLWRSLK
jgi:Zn-finger nucleic acid-binding protein